MTPYGRAILSLRLLDIDPAALGGVVLRARPGPARDALLKMIPPEHSRIHPAMTAEALSGGVDITASLAANALIRQPGVLSAGKGPIILTMAERCPPLMVSRLCAALDGPDARPVIALDEGCEPEEALPGALSDRLAFHVSLDGLGHHDIEPWPPEREPRPLSSIRTGEDIVTQLVTLAIALGITSLRAPSLALRAAQANAALNEREEVGADDILIAAELVYAGRATRLPTETNEEDHPSPDPESQETQQEKRHTSSLPQDILLAAIQSALPAGILDKKNAKAVRTASGSGAGHKQIGNRRGRPLPARDAAATRGHPRVDLMATLRAAVPGQTFRRSGIGPPSRPIIQPSDLRYKRYQDLSDRLLVFAVDASGSAALARLSEAKGAVELLLAEAYARRDHVALISFRGCEAEILLPPTRSLVQTKRRLAELPGGGGTPLAAGLKCGLETAQAAFRKGLSPTLVVLTDGRSNIALDGSPNREIATNEATAMAKQISSSGIDSIVIDTGKRPERSLRGLCQHMGGRYVSLPRANAQNLSHSVSTALNY